MQAIAIVGPRCAASHVQPFIDTAARRKIDLKVLERPTPQDLTRAISEPRPELVLVFGGDGTLHRHLSVLVTAKCPVLPVPTGSGNDFAHTVGIADHRAAHMLFELATS